MTAWPWARRREALLVAVLSFVWLAATAWVRPLMLPDEGRYVGVAWEMLRSGDWLTPTLDGLPYFHKPPLFYWITSASLALFGHNAWAARAAPLLGAWLGALSMFVFVRRWCEVRTARRVLLVLLVQPLFFVGAQFANLDMLVAGCITATITLAAHAALCAESGRQHRVALTLAYAMAAVGVLAKGLIGIVIPALVLGLWLILRRRGRVLLAMLWWPAMGVFVLLAAPWLLLMQASFDGFLYYFIVVQHFKRFAGTGFNNVQPFWFYPALLLLASLPWLVWLLRSLRIRQPRSSVRSLMMLWLAVVVIFFSLPQSKLLGYVLPAVPPLAFLIADGFALRAEPSATSSRLWLGAMLFCALLDVAAVAWVGLHPQRSTREIAQVLAARRQPGEPVVMLDNYDFDLPFYARLLEPVLVVDAWHSPDVARRDNWRKELADAGSFAPANAAAVLVVPADLPARLCASPVTWLVGASGLAAGPGFPVASAVFSERGSTLWRVERRALRRAGGCASR